MWDLILGGYFYANILFIVSKAELNMSHNNFYKQISFCYHQRRNSLFLWSVSFCIYANCFVGIFPLKIQILFLNKFESKEK